MVRVPIRAVVRRCAGEVRRPAPGRHFASHVSGGPASSPASGHGVRSRVGWWSRPSGRRKPPSAPAAGERAPPPAPKQGSCREGRYGRIHLGAGRQLRTLHHVLDRLSHRRRRLLAQDDDVIGVVGGLRSGANAARRIVLSTSGVLPRWRSSVESASPLSSAGPRCPGPARDRRRFDKPCSNESA